MSSETAPILLKDLIHVNPRVPLTKTKSYPFIDMAAIQEWQRDIPLAAVSTREFKGNGSKFEGGDILLARITPVSYTHLDVYKRQEPSFEHEGRCVAPPLCAATNASGGNLWIFSTPFSTCPDVYKRQFEDIGHGETVRIAPFQNAIRFGLTRRDKGSAPRLCLDQTERFKGKQGLAQ